MTALRFLFVLLIILNALAFSAIQGWLGQPEHAGEPERLTNQLNPDSIRLLSQDAPSTAAPSPAVVTLPSPPPAQPDAFSQTATPADNPTCMTWTQLSAEEAQRLYTQATTAGYAPKRSSSEVQSAWWVRIPPQGGRESAERKIRELRDLGITDFFIVQEAGPNQYAVSLGLFKSETSANQHLTQLRNKGVRSAGIAARYTTQHVITLTAPPAYFKTLEKTFDSTHRTQCPQ